MADFSGKQQLAFDTETGWAETSTTFTYAASLAAPVDPSGITQEMLDPERVTARRLAYSKGVKGLWKIGYSTTHNLTGHGSTCAGAISATAQARLLGHVMGGRDATLASGTTYTGGTATAPTTTANNTLPDGGMVRSGALGDGRGGGQFHAVNTHETTTLNLLTGTGTSTASGSDPGGTSVAVSNADVLYSPELAFMADSGSQMTGMRHRLITSNLQLGTYGVFPTGLSFSGLGPGGHPQYTVNWTGSRAAPLDVGAMPQTPNADEFNWQPPSAGGSLFLADVGTASRANACYNIRDFSIDYQMGMTPVPGGAASDQYQLYTGATRAKDTVMVTVVFDAPARDTTPLWWDAWGTQTNQHLLYTLHSADGTAVAFYFRNLTWFGDRPPQSALSDRNVVTLRFRADIGSTTTSDLTLSPMVIAIA